MEISSTLSLGSHKMFLNGNCVIKGTSFEITWISKIPYLRKPSPNTYLMYIFSIFKSKFGMILYIRTDVYIMGYSCMDQIQRSNPMSLPKIKLLFKDIFWHIFHWHILWKRVQNITAINTRVLHLLIASIFSKFLNRLWERAAKSRNPAFELRLILEIIAVFSSG